MDTRSMHHPHEGMTLSGLRDHNERLVLSTIQKQGALAGVEISRVTGLSAQTVSVILRALETEALVARGEPVRGKVGKPLTPWALAADGAYAYGLRLGRRQADLVVMDLAGALRDAVQVAYPYPTPDRIMDFVREGLGRFAQRFDTRRVAGMGIATPYELWNWLDIVGAPKAEMQAWRGFSFAAALEGIADFAVFEGNDATLACAAELTFGQGRSLSDFAYFNLDSFVGGGVVLNGRLFAGRTGNAGAFGTLPVPTPQGGAGQLIQHASIFLLERQIASRVPLPDGLDHEAETWAAHGTEVDPWIAQSARYLALGAVAAAAVVDFEAVVIDGRFPAAVRERLVAATARALAEVDTQGIAPPQILEGTVGPLAGAIGAASQPIQSTYLMGGSAWQ